MRAFTNLPEGKICPVCGTGENKECALIPIDGTDLDDGRTCEAEIVHVECLQDGFRFNSNVGVIYKVAEKGGNYE